ETPLRECAGIIKNDTHRGLPRKRSAAFSPHGRPSGAMVEETGICSIKKLPCWSHSSNVLIG
ncbi:hypothetical protein, partial [Escherichia coli]